MDDYVLPGRLEHCGATERNFGNFLFCRSKFALPQTLLDVRTRHAKVTLEEPARRRFPAI